MDDLILVPTQDQSFTLYNSRLKTYYHSLYGALGESVYIYIQASELEKRLQTGRAIITEIGLGTGLNFLLTVQAWNRNPVFPLIYDAYEPFPPSEKLLKEFYVPYYPEINREEVDYFLPFIAEVRSGSRSGLEWNFFREKWSPEKAISESTDVVFYDVFGPHTTPELWTEDCLPAVYRMLKPGGTMVTFSINGNTRRILTRNQIPFRRPKGFGGKKQILIINKEI